MIARTLAHIAASVPSSVKYRTRGLRSIYIRLMNLHGSVISIKTSAGCLRWRLDDLVSQEFILSTYEPYMQSAFRSFIQRGDVVYDVGAHAGFLTLFAALLVGPTGQVIAFEPNPISRLSLQEQVRLNPDLRITVLPYALGDSSTMLMMNTSSGSSQAHIAEVGDIQAESKTLDELALQGVVPPPNLIKVDVEGYEGKVIVGSFGTLANHKPIILCDYNDATTYPQVTRLLEPLGYKVLEGPPVTAIPDGVQKW